MKIPEKKLEEFKAICQEMGHDLTEAQVYDAAHRTIQFLRASANDPAVLWEDVKDKSAAVSISG